MPRRSSHLPVPAAINHAASSLHRQTHSLSILPQRFFHLPTLTVARALLGKYLVRRYAGRILVGRIVEVEAYLGDRDPASHAYRGMTERNRVMFGDGGHLYVYFTYGMHFCCNVVTEVKGKGCAVLLRAVEPIEGIETMRLLRRKSSLRQLRDEDLCSGPAKICQAFALGKADNGSDLCGAAVRIMKSAGRDAPFQMGRTARIGITSGLRQRWRFFIKGNRFVSRGKPILLQDGNPRGTRTKRPPPGFRRGPAATH